MIKISEMAEFLGKLRCLEDHGFEVSVLHEFEEPDHEILIELVRATHDTCEWRFREYAAFQRWYYQVFVTWLDDLAGDA